MVTDTSVVNNDIESTNPQAVPSHHPYKQTNFKGYIPNTIQEKVMFIHNIGRLGALIEHHTSPNQQVFSIR